MKHAKGFKRYLVLNTQLSLAKGYDYAANVAVYVYVLVLVFVFVFFSEAAARVDDDAGDTAGRSGPGAGGGHSCLR